jgi:hypothetical protein
VSAASNAAIAGASTLLSNSGSVAGPAGGQMTGSSPSSAACRPVIPAGGSIQPISEARFWSSSDDWPVAHSSDSRSVMAISIELPAYSARSASAVNQNPVSGTTGSTEEGPETCRKRVIRPRCRIAVTPPRLGTRICGASLKRPTASSSPSPASTRSVRKESM